MAWKFKVRKHVGGSTQVLLPVQHCALGHTFRAISISAGPSYLCHGRAIPVVDGRPNHVSVYIPGMNGCSLELAPGWPPFWLTFRDLYYHHIMTCIDSTRGNWLIFCALPKFNSMEAENGTVYIYFAGNFLYTKVSWLQVPFLQIAGRLKITPLWK